jgi:hypothetical protein
MPSITRELLDHYRQLGRQLQADVERSHAERFAWHERLVGKEEMARLLRAQEATEQALASPDPRLRRCAVYLLEEHWHAEQQWIGTFEMMAAADPDIGVRQGAVVVLASFYHGSKDRRIGMLLAGIARSESEPAELRLDAYRGLIWLRGLANVWQPLPGKLEFPRDVDWGFVDSFLQP